MAEKKLRLAAVTIAFGVAGSLLAGCASYTPKPIVPTNTAAALERRTLDEPRLSQFIAAASPTYVGGVRTWDISTLTLAALYYHPEVEISRIRLALAKAGIVTAGQIPNPNVSIAPGSGILAAEAPSPLTIGFLINFVIETFGKREARAPCANETCAAFPVEISGQQGSHDNRSTAQRHDERRERSCRCRRIGRSP
jgi:outer membrane protein, heavy metal efflux system